MALPMLLPTGVCAEMPPTPTGETTQPVRVVSPADVCSAEYPDGAVLQPIEPRARWFSTTRSTQAAPAKTSSTAAIRAVMPN